MNFTELNIIEPILKAIDEAGYTEPTEIQKQSIPIVLEGNDIIGCAQTGTGKTASFAIPILQNLTNKPKKTKGIRTLILTPTRELAVQIDDNFKLYSKNLPIRHLAIFGGVNQKPQISTIKNGIDILIATPGRLLDLIGQGYIKLNQLEILVLDEADRMLDMGFVNDIKKILKLVPEERQTLFFSATMPKPIRKFAHSVLRRPKEVNVTPVSSTAETVEQFVYHVDKDNKVELLVQILKENPEERTLIFTRTKHGANRLVRHLEKVGIPAAAIHGDKSQNARQRALNEFKEEKLKVLIATDIAARGIDIDMLPYVINFELPNVPETYVHRIGRTGRAGKEGKAISFCAPDEKGDLINIEKLIGRYVNVLKTPKMEKKPSSSSSTNKTTNSGAKKEFFKKKNDRNRRRK
ncbi:ATP-dependent RNA helicase RhlE [Chishuiella changwenlii]|uniref:DEAD-box ATP-dependent RNA helicase RhpA n=1 Tax=Chishuiella changwenlii TaxID=1434701 RepID=A0A1M7BE34_9FLAO|nr:DEAD/DEAH box helicase [Chishuiella changwenlii]GGE96607.1 DEAD/DEAH box family ATP-dependent RNA helicase [Chishuiella changwenlii]SHL53191.1 ATP-dependent RNA helicase RhlE [Chishuiella changwenlii]